MGFRAALTRTVNDYARNNKLFKSEMKLGGEDLREGLVAVVSVKLPDPQFEGQTKTGLGNSSIRGIVDSLVTEGLAEYFEVAAEERAGGNPHGKYVKFSAYLGQIPGLEELEQLRDVSQMTRTRYRHAWAWVHFLLHGPPEAREELRRFLADLQALTPPGLLSRRLRQRLPDLDARFAEHCRKWKL